MNRSLIQVYALAVCFCAVMCFVVALGLAVYDVVRIAAPAFTIDDSMLWQNDEHFLMFHPDKKGLAPADLAALRSDYERTALAAEQRSATRRLAFLSIVLVIDAAVWALHWRIARRTDRFLEAPRKTPDPVVTR